MSRRKQGKPQQLRRDPLDDYMEAESLITSIEDAEEEVQSLEKIDMLKCGDCQQEFVLSDIVHFIEHKKHCYGKIVSNFGSDEEEYDDTEEPTGKVGRLPNTNPFKKSPYRFTKDELLTHSKDIDLEPSSYVCSKCRKSFTSAWILLQHAQNIHHMKIYLENVDKSFEKTTFQHQQLENEHSLPSNLGNLDHPPPLRPVANGIKGSMQITASGNDSSLSSIENSSLPFFIDGSTERPKLGISASTKYFPSGSSSLSYPTAIDQEAVQRSSNFEVNSPKMTKVQQPNTDEEDDEKEDDDNEEEMLAAKQQNAMDISQFNEVAEQNSPPATSSTITKHSTSEFCQLNAAERLRLLASQQPTAFSSKHLKQHRLFLPPYLATHTSLRHQGKLKTCEFCGKQFKFQSNLIVHRRSHTGEKPYKCQLCDHACSQASKLKRHMKIHMNRSGRWGVKPQFRQTVTSSLVKISAGQLTTAPNLISRTDLEDRDKEDTLLEKEHEADGSSSPNIIEEYINTSEETLITSPQKAFNSALNKVLTKSKLEINEAYKQVLPENKALNNPELNSESNNEKFGDRTNCSDQQTLPTMVPLPSAHRAPSYQPKFPKEVEDKIEADSLASSGVKVEPASPTTAVSTDKMYSHWILHPAAVVNANSVPSSSASEGSASSAGNASFSTVSTRKEVNLAGSGLLDVKVIKPDAKKDTCEFCGKIFKNCSNLTVHRRSHTGEKPYKCELCSYACAQSSKLTRHMKTHGHGSKEIYRCEVCNMPFSVFSTLEKHMKKWHWEVLSSRYEGEGLSTPNAGP